MHTHLCNCIHLWTRLDLIPCETPITLILSVGSRPRVIQGFLGPHESAPSNGISIGSAFLHISPLYRTQTHGPRYVRHVNERAASCVLAMRLMSWSCNDVSKQYRIRSLPEVLCAPELSTSATYSVSTAVRCCCRRRRWLAGRCACLPINVTSLLFISPLRAVYRHREQQPQQRSAVIRVVNSPRSLVLSGKSTIVAAIPILLVDRIGISCSKAVVEDARKQLRTRVVCWMCHFQ